MLGLVNPGVETAESDGMSKTLYPFDLSCYLQSLNTTVSSATMDLVEGHSKAHN